MLIPTTCPLGGAPESDVEVYPANFDPADLNADTFSARRMPDHLHYRMVRNGETGLLRADPILDIETLANLYRESTVTYFDIEAHITRTYLEYAERVWPVIPDKRGVLEIGCGDGCVLAEFAGQGFETVAGVEPSAEAAARGREAGRPYIREGLLTDGLFAPETFSLITGFQVLDHIPNPNDVLGTCHGLLAPGGITYWICHDIEHWLPKLLGKRCPMIDIEHTVLYNKRTIRALFEQNGFEVLDVFSVANKYPLGYWLHLAPIPGAIRNVFQKLFAVTGLEKLLLRANLGNQGIVARKKDDGEYPR